MTAGEDRELVARFKSGDQAAFAQLVRLYQKRVYAVAFRMVRDEEEAKDLTQEVFVKMYATLKDFRGEASVFTWAYRATVNLSINHLRRKKIISWVPLLEAEEKSEEPKEGLSDLETARLKQAIAEAVKKLPPKQRAIFILRHYEELGNEEIAQIVGKSVGAVKANYFQALQKMKKHLAEWKNVLTGVKEYELPS
ncbi:MAG: sigma-70 family RNA polymerase sigma factor [candidate division Zixibacteria bacterium]|nr:sigma-70 family RNA polymerase sigma factor [candidate division Zixibacteria bacterium]